MSEKNYEIYEHICPSLARFHILLAAHRAENERGPKGRSKTRRWPEAEDSVGEATATGTDIGKSFFSTCFYASDPILSFL